MRRSKFVSGRSVLCEGLESRNLFSNAVAIDASFKAVGYAQPTFRTGADEYANSAIVAKDGRIVVSGTSELLTNDQYDDRVVVAVFNKDGSGSTKFNGNGKLILSAADSAKLGGSAAVIGQTSDGGFYLEGGYGVVLKLNANGTIATGYGRAGYVSPIAGYNDTNHGNTLLLSDGSIEEATYDGQAGVLRFQKADATGKVTSSLRRTINVGYGTAVVDGTGITVQAGTKLYRFKTNDLSKISGFGTGGVLDLEPAFVAWAEKHGPFYSDDGDPITTAVPNDLNLAGTFDAKSGLGFLGRIDETSPNAVTTPGDGDAPSYTTIDFQVSADGKAVVVDSGNFSGTLLAHTAFFAFEGSGADGFAFGGTFYKTDGTTRTFDPPLKYEEGSAAGVALASDGSAYVVGAIANGGPERFTVFKTTPV